MNLKITRVSLKYGEGIEVDSVNVHFRFDQKESDLYFSGSVQLTGEEYEGNESIPKLTKTIENYIINELNKEDEPEENPEGEPKEE